VTLPDLPGHPEPRWPAIAAFVTAWTYPATSARRTAHVSLWRAYVVHFLAALLTFVMITMLVSLIDFREPTHYLFEIIEGITGDWWRRALVALTVCALGIEFGYLLLAALLMPWGAADERLRSSWSHALRITWLHTSHALPTVLLVGGLSAFYEEAARNDRRMRPYPTYPQWIAAPTPPAGAAPNSKAWREYSAKMEEYKQKTRKMQAEWQAAYENWRRHRPLLLKYGEGTITTIGTACAFWLLWAMHRAVSVRRSTPTIQRPPTCEFCGYNLVATPIESRCPECGQLAVDSLGPHARPGTPWDRREHVGRLKAWWRTGSDAIFRPSQLGRQIRVLALGRDHGRFLAVHLPAVFIMGVTGIVSCFLFDWCRNPGLWFQVDILSVLGPVFGGMTVLTVLAIAGLTAGVVGLVFSLRNGRNLLPASVQAACCLGHYLTAWTLFGTVLAFAAFVADENQPLRQAIRQMNLNPEVTLFWLWLIPNLACLGGYAILVWKTTAAAQYANR